MAPSYASLTKEAIALLDKFSAGRQSLDDFIEGALEDLQNVNTHQRKFILDIVSGCAEQKKLLDAVISVFYGQNMTSFFKGDYSQCAVICYLATFALGDIGIQRFSSIVKSLDIKKMHTFLNFFLTNLTTLIQTEWSKIYDAEYVEKNWIAPLLEWRPEISILLEQLSLQLSQGNQIKKTPTKTTEPEEFALTKPKLPAMPQPELIPLQKKCRPVPGSTHRPPKEKKILEEIKKKNHQKAEELFYEANAKQVKCGNPEKSEHTKKVMSQIREEMDSKLKFNSVYSSGLPSNKKTKNWPIKLNNAAILRNGVLCDRKVEEELQRMEDLVEGAHEPSPFLQWQREMREKDLHEQLAVIEHRRLEVRISNKEAAIARTRLMEHNQKTAQLKKEETAELMRKYAEKRLQDEKEMRDFVQQAAEGHKNSEAAKERIQKFKQEIVKEVSKQNRELLRQAQEEAQAALQRKFEIICEIRALKSVPHNRVKHFDDTETAGHELLGEMSLFELKERLALLKKAQLAKAQEQILQEKQKKKQKQLERLETIDFHSRERAQAAAIRKEEERERRLRIQQAVTQDERVLALQRKLEETQQEYQRLRQIDCMRAKTSEQAAAPSVKKTETHSREINWKELERCLERHIQNETPYAAL